MTTLTTDDRFFVVERNGQYLKADGTWTTAVNHARWFISPTDAYTMAERTGGIVCSSLEAAMKGTRT